MGEVVEKVQMEAGGEKSKFPAFWMPQQPGWDQQTQEADYGGYQPWRNTLVRKGREDKHLDWDKNGIELEGQIGALR